MVDLNKAYKVVKENNPGMRANTCVEQDRYYVFSLIPDDLEKGDGFANSCVYLVDKNTGDYMTAHFTHVMYNQIIREIDVSTLE